MATFEWKPARSLEECEAIMTAPGELHELEHVIIDNRVHKAYKNLWPSLRAFWLTRVTANTELHNNEYLVFEGTRITYGEADQIIQKLASILRQVYGVKKGDRVGISMRNYPEWVLVFWAASLLGAVPTAFNAWLPLDSALHCVRLTTPKVLFLDSERLDLLSSVLPSMHIPVVVVRPYNERRVSGISVKEWSKVLSQYQGPTDAWKKEGEILPEDDATIYFTSGTTGLPKGVLSSQRGWLGNCFSSLATARRSELRRGSDAPPPLGHGPEVEKRAWGELIAVPLFHVTGSTSQMFISTFKGAKIVLMRKWDKDIAAKLIRDEKITNTTGVPSIVYDLFESGAVGTTTLDNIGTGGAPAADSFASEVLRKFPGTKVSQGYGLSETNSIAVHVIGEDYLQRPGSTGLPPPIVDLLVVDPHTNKILPHDQIGELWIRGPLIMKGYFNNPKATEEAITRDGWFKTGDLASIDKDGFVYIKDRVKDIIIRGGENIHSITVENALFADARILDCAVVGIPDKRLGELVGALVVLRSEWVGKVTEEDILKAVKPRLPAFAVPVMVKIQSQTIERNAAGKTLKREIRKTLSREWERRQKVKPNAKL
ncbi:hypothetical protein Clacol_008415 [Clathrus columnatus]|uniref:Acetyl-CoA synthetase-like protein n=1 Tax=Clathrus columnatus TaxID=1419009 RepID=A0AAV5AQI7_9AGAM|nr:hypothetical protein Clacol_008415 [Clathrus columnatus]